MGTRARPNLLWASRLAGVTAWAYTSSGVLDVRVSEQLLHYLPVLAVTDEERRDRAAESVPPDRLVDLHRQAAFVCPAALVAAERWRANALGIVSP